ncbi:proteasome subunit beta type-6 [Macrosteles quadrilineatus]|uniref:proteasome subunit beta type-6 n=1 Tax=Macrosteles quadrilineatus TaxID=74068 RepID=UPI0023E192E5|nr:proteasome subunit beta type-6 [Macrosteles quadrilineatus]
MATMVDSGSFSTAPDWFMEAQSTGTTIMAVEFEGGVVIGADSRATTGSYVCNRIADKLTRVTDYIYCCRSGSSADTQAIADIVSYHMNFYRAETGEEPLVESVAALFRELCYSYRDQLTAGILVAGWDKRKGGQVYVVPIGGMCVRQKVAIGGSGSTYIYGYIDGNFKDGMSVEEIKKFVTNAISLAMQRDGSSGGVVRLGVIANGNPIERSVIFGEQLPNFGYAS